MINIYSNIISDNQAVSRWWLFIAIFLVITCCIFKLDFKLAMPLFFIPLGMNIIASKTLKKFNFVSKVASFTSGFGAMLSIVFALLNRNKQITNNFFLIYNNLPYILGVSLFFAGVFIQSLIFLVAKSNFSFKNIAISALSLIMILALISIFISFYKIKSTLVGNIAFDHQEFYSSIFHTSADILDFFYIQVMMLCGNYILQKYLFKKEIPPIKNRLDNLAIQINIIAILNIFGAIHSFSRFFKAIN